MAQLENNMITKGEFIDLISAHKKWNKKIDEVCSILGTDLFEATWIDYGYTLFDKLLSLEFNRYAVDDINWWLWEKNGDPEMKMWDKDGNEIPTETIEDLWEIVKDNRKQ